MKNMSLLLPSTAASDTHMWATVTQVSPLRIRVDGETTALPFTPDTLVTGLAVDDRVWIGFANNDDLAFLGKRVVVMGRAGGTITVPAHTHPNPAVLTSKVLATGQNLNASSTTLQDVNGLAIPVVVGTYSWKLSLPYECVNNTPDIQVAFTFPTTSSASYAFQALALAVSGSPPYLLNMAGGSLVSGTSFATAGVVGLRATIYAYGHFVFTASGTVQVRAAQNTSDSSTVVVHPGAQMDMVLIT